MAEMGKERGITVGGAVTTPAVYRDMVKLREELDSIIETLEIMSDEELMEGIRRSKEDVNAGRYKELKSVEELMRSGNERYDNFTQV
jgi:hypothetical protein